MNVINAHIVPKNIDKIRLSDYAVGIFENIPSRKGIKKAINRGEVLVNSKVASTGYWVQPNDTIELTESIVNPPKGYKMNLEIVYEDESLAIINKPSGIPVSGNQYRTIQNTLVDNLEVSALQDALKWPKPVHRLDSPTSGLLLVAKTATAIMHLGQQFENKTIQKNYVAIVIGEMPNQGVIKGSLSGLFSETYYELLKVVPSLRNDRLSLLKLMPKTGRTHQIRKHLSGLGFPILGDKLYGKEGQVLQGKGLFLCAVGLQFEHPITKVPINVSIETPYKFTALLERENKRWNKYH